MYEMEDDTMPTYVSHYDRTCFISEEDRSKYGARAASTFTVVHREAASALAVTGKTFALKSQIKSFSHEHDVEEVKWMSEASEWWVRYKSTSCNVHQLATKLSDYLLASRIGVLKQQEQNRRDTLAANKRRRSKEEARVKEVEAANEALQPFRAARLQALVTWREQHDVFKKDAFFSRGNWYNASEMTDKTCCTSCGRDILGHYGSEEHPFDATLKPDQAFLENCPYCRYHFFYNWN